MPLFTDRRDAGRQLAAKLTAYAGRADLLVLALPRGGVPVAYEVARALHAPLDVFLVRKLGVPGHEELAMGAIASGGIVVLNEEVIYHLAIGPEILDAVTSREAAELARREEVYRQGKPAPDVRSRTVILIDDGLATGATMRAAAQAILKMGPVGLVIAVPVAAHSVCREFNKSVAETVCAFEPEPFLAVGFWYSDFSPTSDAEVNSLLRDAERLHQIPATGIADYT